MTSVAPNRLASSSRFAWMSMAMILDAPAIRAPLTALSPTPPAPKDGDRFAGAYIRGVQDRTGARYTAAAEESSLGERKSLGYDGELVFVDQRAFGEAAQPKALENSGAVTAQARGIGRSA